MSAVVGRVVGEGCARRQVANLKVRDPSWENEFEGVTARRAEGLAVICHGNYRE